MIRGALSRLAAPAHWDWQDLWAVAPRVKEIGRPDLPALSVFLDAGVVPRSSRDDNHNQLGEDLSRYLVVHPKDIVFNKLRTWQGGLGVSEHEGIVSPAYFVCRPRASTNPRFLHYLLRSGPYLAELTRISKWMPPSQFDTPWEQLRKLPILLPPLDEQRRIADFLDAETARIDSLAALRERQVRLALTRLETLAKRETGRVLVRGVEKSPEGWATHPLRRAISGIKTGATPPSSGPELWVEDTRPGTVPWYGPSSFQGLMHLGVPVKYLPSDAVTERVVPLFAKGSVLIIGIGATAGKVAYLDHDASANQQITALSPGRGVSGKFLAWQLWAATQELRELAPYTTLPIINNDFLKSFPVAMPSVDLQSAVARKLDRAAERVGALHTAAAQASHLVQERRQTLITAAVTGQFDVSTASGRNVTEGVSA